MRLQAAAATAQDVGNLTAPATPLVSETVDLSSQLGLDNIRQSLIRQARDLRCALPASRMVLHRRPVLGPRSVAEAKPARIRHSSHPGVLQHARR